MEPSMTLNSPDPDSAELEDGSTPVRTMTGTLSCDFANGHVAIRNNLFDHRGRLGHEFAARRDRIQRQARIGQQSR